MGYYNVNIKSSKSSPPTNQEKRIMLMSTERSHEDKIYDHVHFINKISCLNEVQYNNTTSSLNEINSSSIAVTSTAKKEKITAEKLAKRLNIPYEMVKQTLLVTTQ